MLMQAQFGATVTLTQVFNDVVNVLTGATTSFAGLSASFTSATFFNTTPPGWTSYDAAAGNAANSVTPCVIRSPYSDDGTKYKNVYIFSSGAGHLCFNGYETWDSSGHTGTYPMKTSPADASWQAVDFTSATYTGGTLIISASANHIFIQVLTSAAAPGPHVFFSEYSRQDPWNTVANGYPSWCQSGNWSSGAISTTLDNTSVPRLLNTNTLVDTANGFGPYGNDLCFSPGGGVYSSTGVATATTLTSFIVATGVGALEVKGADSTKTAAHYLLPVQFRQYGRNIMTGALLGGDCSAINGSIFFSQRAYGAVLDTLTVGTDSYLLTGSARNTSAVLALKRA